MIILEPIKTKYIVEYKLEGQSNWKYYNASSNRKLARKFMDEAKDLDCVVEVRLRSKVSRSLILNSEGMGERMFRWLR